ncbi:MAG: hypothetical protein KDD28_08135, partial [Phaeodactylibacter sp.]|nr:hypothetical protein [Phaeodactylibacter sp.]
MLKTELHPTPLEFFSSLLKIGWTLDESNVKSEVGHERSKCEGENQAQETHSDFRLPISDFRL